jgi:small glutamine-rich tetratricopeptide repeat-containing protein alpha
MANLKTDSPLSRRIVQSFLHFLDSVEPAAGVDIEGLEVAKECLTEVFKVNRGSGDSRSKIDSLIDIFSSREVVEQNESKPADSNGEFSENVPAATINSAAQTLSNPKLARSSRSMDEDPKREAQSLGISKDELFGQWFSGLEKIGYFNITPDGHDDQVQLDKATSLFHNALKEMEQSGVQIFDPKTLSEIFKTQGNKAVQSKLYPDAIELYTFAIALCQDNAVYYCNRAAAYTQMNKYDEAIKDCRKSIEIDQNYSKAYSRLGFAYYAQGNYYDAIEQGFNRARLLDPNNESVKENIRVAEQKLMEQYRRYGPNGQYSSSSDQNHEDPNDEAPGIGSWSQHISFNNSNLPPELSGMFTNMASSSGNFSSFGDSEIRVGGNLPGDQIPIALRSVMEMFSAGAPPHPNNPNPSAPDNNINGSRPPPS